jgi:hypothetical protein
MSKVTCCYKKNTPLYLSNDPFNDSSLISVLRFDGNAYDPITGNTLAGTHTYTTGVFDQAISANGADNKILTANVPSIKSISLWAKISPSAPAGYEDIWTTQSDNFIKISKNNEVYFDLTGYGLGTVYSIDTTQWNFYTVTLSDDGDGNYTTKLYINAVEENSYTNTYDSNSYTEYKILGNNAAYITLDQFMLFNRTLTLTEIQTLYNM